MDIMRRQSIQNLPIKITDMENTTRWEKILSDTTQRIYMGTSSLDDDDVMEQLTQLEELLRFFYRDYYGNNSKK